MGKGFLVSVFVNKRTGDCTANGTSSKTDTLFLVKSDVKSNFPEISEYEDTELDKIMVIDSITVCGGEPHYFARKKYETEEEKSKRGPMFGGNFMYTSDSRFPFEYPIPIHDRYEDNV